ncbi:LD-carboxypeptidase [Achromobacter pulmonis]|uniref:LD-carboxypeptidase n=1 Tax=Achromobacter pulmonis TaxID=1389932 RepID=A0A2N8KPS7_9BURK|nr:LD-carboxypeptidase [Achromobacter pulmonis]PND35457.1 LD-carboxypeptidase [Achromobacter pulmonis]
MSISKAAKAVHDHGHDHECGEDCGHDHDHDHGHFHARPDARGIYLISPSSAVRDPATVDLARERLQAQGFKTALDRTALAEHQRFAGTDAQRLASLTRAVKQKLPIVMVTRGGYGVGRLLPAIDWKAMADSGKRFVGMSDFTAFNLALLAQTGAVSYTGATAVADFGGKKVDDLTEALFGEIMRGELEILSFETQDADPVDCRGILWGGNLAMLTSLAGTPYMPKVRGGILFLEDVAEHPYRIERMLIQLHQAGILGRQKAIVLGRFTDYRLAPHDKGYDLPEVVAWLRRTVKVPVVTGLPYGHVATKATLPIGQKVGLATEAGLAHLVLDEHTH